MFKEFTWLQRENYKGAWNMAFKRLAEQLVIDSESLLLIVPESYELLNSFFCFLRASMNVCPACVSNLYLASRRPGIVKKAKKEIAQHFFFFSRIQQKKYIEAHLSLFENFRYSHLMDLLVKGQSFNLSNRTSIACENLYTYLICNFLNMQFSGDRSILSNSSTPPKNSPNVLAKFLQGQPKNVLKYFEQIKNAIFLNNILNQRYNVFIADLPVLLASSCVIDSNSQADTFENTSLEFLLKSVKMLLPKGIALIVVPITLKTAPSFNKFLKAVACLGNYNLLSCNYLFDLWWFSRFDS